MVRVGTLTLVLTEFKIKGSPCLYRQTGFDCYCEVTGNGQRGQRGQGDGGTGCSDFSTVRVLHPGGSVEVKFEGAGLEAGTLVW